MTALQSPSWDDYKAGRKAVAPAIPAYGTEKMIRAAIPQGVVLRPPVWAAPLAMPQADTLAGMPVPQAAAQPARVRGPVKAPFWATAMSGMLNVSLLAIMTTILAQPDPAKLQSYAMQGAEIYEEGIDAIGQGARAAATRASRANAAIRMALEDMAEDAGKAGADALAATKSWSGDLVQAASDKGEALLQRLKPDAQPPVPAAADITAELPNTRPPLDAATGSQFGPFVPLSTPAPQQSFVPEKPAVVAVQKPEETQVVVHVPRPRAKPATPAHTEKPRAERAQPESPRRAHGRAATATNAAQRSPARGESANPTPLAAAPQKPAPETRATETQASETRAPTPAHQRAEVQPHEQDTTPDYATSGEEQRTAGSQHVRRNWAASANVPPVTIFTPGEWHKLGAADADTLSLEAVVLAEDMATRDLGRPVAFYKVNENGQWYVNLIDSQPRGIVNRMRDFTIGKLMTGLKSYFVNGRVPKTSSAYYFEPTKHDQDLTKYVRSAHAQLTGGQHQPRNTAPAAATTIASARP